MALRPPLSGRCRFRGIPHHGFHPWLSASAHPGHKAVFSRFDSSSLTALHFVTKPDNFMTEDSGDLLLTGPSLQQNAGQPKHGNFKVSGLGMYIPEAPASRPTAATNRNFNGARQHPAPANKRSNHQRKQSRSCAGMRGIIPFRSISAVSTWPSF